MHPTSATFFEISFLLYDIRKIFTLRRTLSFLEHFLHSLPQLISQHRRDLWSKLDGLGWERHLDVGLLESLFNSAVHLSSYQPLLDRQGLEAGLDNHAVLSELIHTHYLQWFKDCRMIRFLLHQLL